MFFQKIACIINIMDINYNSDVIVIGAGPCGIAAALEVARGGKKVVLIEKGEHPDVARQSRVYDAEYALQADGERNQLLPCETVMDEERRESHA